jgi:hypothetical protein
VSRIDELPSRQRAPIGRCCGIIDHLHYHRAMGFHHRCHALAPDACRGTGDTAPTLVCFRNPGQIDDCADEAPLNVGFMVKWAATATGSLWPVSPFPRNAAFPHIPDIAAK